MLPFSIINLFFKKLSKVKSPKRVTGPISEVKPSELVADQNVAGPEAGVALLPDVSHDLASGRIWISRVTVEIANGMVALD